MKDMKPGGPLDLKGVETRSAGLRAQTRLLIIGAVIVAVVVIGLLHPADKPLQPAQSVLRPGETNGLVFRNTKLTLPVPAGWELAKEQKTDELYLRNADDTCRAMVMRVALDATPDSFQQGMAKQMRQDGHTVTTQQPLTLSGRRAAHMHADLKSGAAEEVYSVHAGSSMYTLVLVKMTECQEDLSATAQGFHIAA